MKKKKLLYISNVAVPQQIKFANALQKYFDAKFWFYEYPDRTRGSWWRMDLGKDCKVLDEVWFASDGILGERYYSRDLGQQLDDLDPDIVIISGLSVPSNYFAYKWAKKNSKKIVLFTERSRDKHGNIRKNTYVWRALKYLYRDLDMIITATEDAVDQFKNTFGFGNIVNAGRYSSDLDGYFNHPCREKKPGYNYIFANRLTDIYNPILAFEIFSEILKKYPDSYFYVNASGELRPECEQYIAINNIASNVAFLDDIKKWSDLGGIYARSDILLLPARFSNGNFTIIEAMASGMGVIISNKVLGVGHLIEDGVNGYNCNPDVESFVDRVENYINNPDVFKIHQNINREIVRPLGEAGTAAFYSELLRKLVED